MVTIAASADSHIDALGLRIRARLILGLGLLLSFVFCGCAKTIEPTTQGGESHFLRRCNDTCSGDLQCVSNVCTVECTAKNDRCGELSAAASCTSAGIGSRGVAVCDATCRSNADCRAISQALTCDNGFCRGPAIDPIDAGKEARDSSRPLSSDSGSRDGQPSNARVSSVDAGDASQELTCVDRYNIAQAQLQSLRDGDDVSTCAVDSDCELVGIANRNGCTIDCYGLPRNQKTASAIAQKMEEQNAGICAPFTDGSCTQVATTSCVGPPPIYFGCLNGQCQYVSDTPISSPCFSLTEDQCKANAACEAVKQDVSSGVTCEFDDRGFSSSCVSAGCRPMDPACTGKNCSNSCGSGQWAVDPGTGCPSCKCLDNIRISSMKGWDIAAWNPSALTAPDKWVFNLVAGTNRIKTCDEVVLRYGVYVTETKYDSNGGVWHVYVDNLLALKAALARLPPGEYVSICNGDSVCADIETGCGLGTLPTEIVEDLKRYIVALGLIVN